MPLDGGFLTKSETMGSFGPCIHNTSVSVFNLDTQEIVSPELFVTSFVGI